MKFLKLIVLIFLGTTPAFAGDSFDDVIARQAKIDQFVHGAPLFIKDKSLTALRKLDQLKDERVKKESNPHIPEKIIEYRTLFFEGLKIYGAIHEQKELMPIQITVTDSRWKIINKLNVGSSVDQIEQVLGKPTKEYSNIKQYCGETECVDFYIKDAKIIKMELNYYLD